MRYAIFFLPEPDSEIARLGARWLGRDIETGTLFPPPAIAGLDPEQHARLVAGPRRYGFHATLKAPFRLAEGASEDALVEAFHGFARAATRVRIPVLSLSRLRGFFVLEPAVADPDLEMLGSDAEHHFERFRAPATAEETARRAAGGLSPRQTRHLERYGYPFILDEFRFHLTLTGRVPESEAETVVPHLEDALAPIIGQDMPVDRAALVIEPAPETDFKVLAVSALGDPLAYTRGAIHVEASMSDAGFVGRHRW